MKFVKIFQFLKNKLKNELILIFFNQNHLNNIEIIKFMIFIKNFF